MLSGIVFHKNSSMKAFVANFFLKQYTFQKDKIQYGDKHLILPSLFVHWKLNHSRFAFVDINIALYNFCQ